MIRSITVLALLAVLYVACGKMHMMEKHIPRKDFVKQGRAEKSAKHEVFIAIPKKNLNILEKEVHERSTPGSAKYQQWMSFEEVRDLTQNLPSFTKVKNWLENNHAEIKWVSVNQDYIRVESTIENWENLLNCEFYQFYDFSFQKIGKYSKNGKSIFRALEYSIPIELKDDIFGIFHTVQTPPPYKKHYHVKEHVTKGMPMQTKLRLRQDNNVGSSGVVTVDFINSYYNVGTNNATGITQCVFETDASNSESYLGTTDLTTFQKNYGLPVQAVSEQVGDRTTTTCPTNSGTIDCVESNLDVQYIMGVAQYAATIYWWVAPNPDPFVAWIEAIASETNPPLVNSMSWGAVEQGYSSAMMDTFNNEALSLASRGVTIFVSAGDDGVSNYNCQCTDDSSSSASGTDWTGTNTWTGQGYFPSFPATSPYVTATGATMGPQSGQPEIACQSNYGGIITTGGGFSTHFAAPAHQKKAVEYYFNNLKFQPPAGFNNQGRAYPDISLIGVWYQVVISGAMESVFGTSCTAPALAAFTSILNNLRIQQGLTPGVGWLNPTLWSYGYNTTVGLNTTVDAAFNDVTEGVNNCCAGQVISQLTCCTSGFNASKGWDPATGWGSVNFKQYAAMFGVTADDYVSNSSSSNTPTTLQIIEAVIIVIVVLVFLCSVCAWLFRMCRRSRAPPQQSQPVIVVHHVQNPVSPHPPYAHQPQEATVVGTYTAPPSSTYAARPSQELVYAQPVPNK